MRYAKCLFASAMVLTIIAGCSNPSRSARQRLARDMDDARARFLSATKMLGEAYYPPQGAGSDVAAVPPVVNKAALAELEAAAGIMIKAVSEAGADAPPGWKSQAQVLLAEIYWAQGQHHAQAAAAYATEAGLAREETYDQIAGLRDRGVLAEYFAAVAQTSPEQTRSLRDALVASAQAADGRLRAVQGKIAEQEAAVAGLERLNEPKRQEVRRLRSASDSEKGEKRLELFISSNMIEAEINLNVTKILLAQQTLGILNDEKALLEKEKSLIAAGVSALDGHLEDIDQSRTTALGQKKVTETDAARFAEGAEAKAGEVAKSLRSAADQEKLALDALGKAVETLKGIAQKDEGAFMLSLRASAAAGLADVRAGQLASDAANKALGQAMAGAWKLLGREAPPAAGALASYLPDAAKTRTEAEANYKTAEEDLDSVCRQHLTGVAANTKWMYQGKLAAAYLGHYRLTGDESLRQKAMSIVEEALKGTQASPYLAYVAALKEQIEAAGK